MGCSKGRQEMPVAAPDLPDEPGGGPDDPGQNAAQLRAPLGNNGGVLRQVI